MKKGTINKLSTAAMNARDNAYCPYSDFAVGAALLADDGNVYAGANVEVANYKSNCAEESAIAAMITAGARKIDVITVIGASDAHLITPCGSCRQKIREFADEDTEVISLDTAGAVARIMTLGELLPDSFGPDHLDMPAVKAPRKSAGQKPVKKKTAAKPAPKRTPKKTAKKAKKR